MGTAVMIPCPISDFSRIRVTRLSGAMCTQALNGLGVFFSCCCAESCAAKAGRWKPTNSPTPATVPDFKNSRRSRVARNMRTPRNESQKRIARQKLRRARWSEFCQTVSWVPALSCAHGHEWLCYLRRFGVGGLNFRRAVNGFANALVGSAAADVAAHEVVDISVSWAGFLCEQRRRRHNLSALTVAALWHVNFHPGLLHRMAAVRGKSFNSRYFLAGHSGNRRDAR